MSTFDTLIDKLIELTEINGLQWKNLYEYEYIETNKKNNNLIEHVIKSYSYNRDPNNDKETGIIIDASYCYPTSNYGTLYLFRWYIDDSASNENSNAYTIGFQKSDKDKVVTFNNFNEHQDKVKTLYDLIDRPQKQDRHDNIIGLMINDLLK